MMISRFMIHHVAKLVAATALLILGTTPLVAGGAQQAVEEDEVTITMWTHDALYIEYFGKRVQAMNERNPDLHIIFDAQEMPDPMTSFISAYVAREQLPDMIGVLQSQFPLLMEDDVVADVLVDLTDRIGNRYDQFVEGRWALYMDKGRIYGVESGLSTAVYYYQPAIFEEYDVHVPTTWDEFFEVGRELGQHGVSIGAMDDGSNGLFSMMFLQRGGQFFDEQGSFVLGEPENRRHAIAVLERIRQGVDDNTLFVVLGGEFWGALIPTAFSEGRLAGIVMPDWYNTAVLQPGVEHMAGEWRVAPLPVWTDVDGYTTTVWGGTGFAITQASDYPDIVWEIIEDGYMTLDGQLDRYDTISYFPTMYDALDHPRVSELEHEFFGGQKIGSVFAETARNTPPLWQSPTRPYLFEALSAELVPFIEGELTPEQFVDRVIEITERDAGL